MKISKKIVLEDILLPMYHSDFGDF